MGFRWVLRFFCVLLRREGVKWFYVVFRGFRGFHGF